MSDARPQTYAAARRRLARLGFTRTHVPGSHVAYEHPAGAVVLLPERDEADPVDPVHQAMIDGTLRDYGLDDSPVTPPASRTSGSPGTAGTPGPR